MTITAADLRSSFRRDGIAKTFTIAFGPRSGSTILAHILWSAGAGKPTEYFQYPFGENKHFREHAPEKWFDVFQSLVRGQSANEIFASKMSHLHRAHLDGWLRDRIAGYDGLRGIFPSHRWIFVRRRDVIRQAISWAIAEESGLWHLKKDQQGRADLAVPYDFFLLFEKLRAALSANFGWELYFSSTQTAPLTVYYEDFLADKAASLQVIAAQIGFDADRLIRAMESAAGEMLKISDRYEEAYERMRERFVADLLRLGEDDLFGPAEDRWKAFFTGRLWRADSARAGRMRGDESAIQRPAEYACSAVSSEAR